MLSQGQKLLKQIYFDIIEEVKAPALYKKYLHRWEDTLFYRNTPLEIQGKKVFLAGSGKASLGMAEAVLEYLPAEVYDSLFITPKEAPESPFNTIMGDHPIPGNNSLEAGINMKRFLTSLTKNDTLLYFLSGGSSAMFELPIKGIDLNDMRELTATCLASGADIHEINTLRSSLSLVKGGKLTNLCKATIYIFVLSDVMGNDLSIIGSGPFYTAGHLHNINDIIIKYNLDSSINTNTLYHLKNAETHANSRSVSHFLIGTNMELLQAAETACFDHNIKPITFPESLRGEARESGKMIADMIKKYNSGTPVAFIFGGENTVTLNDSPGKGGRTQELALSVLNELKDECKYSLLAAGSDGMDGMGGAAGAVICSETYQIIQEKDLSIQEYLDRHDSYGIFKECNALIECGYTGTNVADIVVAIKY